MSKGIQRYIFLLPVKTGPFFNGLESPCSPVAFIHAREQSTRVDILCLKIIVAQCLCQHGRSKRGCSVNTIRSWTVDTAVEAWGHGYQPTPKSQCYRVGGQGYISKSVTGHNTDHNFLPKTNHTQDLDQKIPGALPRIPAAGPAPHAPFSLAARFPSDPPAPILSTLRRHWSLFRGIIAVFTIFSPTSGNPAVQTVVVVTTPATFLQIFKLPLLCKTLVQTRCRPNDVPWSVTDDDDRDRY